jgi:DNA-binding transcriptional regulator YiaG
MDKKYKSEILQVIHEDASANFKVGGISEERMRYYDEKCLVSETLDMESASSSSEAGIPVSAYAAS